MKNFLYRIYFFLFLKDAVISVLIDRFYWVRESNLNNSMSISYKPIGLAYTQTLYINFHYENYDVLYGKRQKNQIREFKTITILSDNRGLNSIYVFGKLRIKVLRWHFKDKFFESMSEYQSNIRNSKFSKIININKD